MDAQSPFRDNYVVKLFLAYFERAPEYEALLFYQATLDAMLSLAWGAGMDENQTYRQFSEPLHAT